MPETPKKPKKKAHRVVRAIYDELKAHKARIARLEDERKAGATRTRRRPSLFDRMFGEEE